MLGPRLRHVFVFGSWAWGTPHAESDIDVCLVVDNLSHAEWSRLFDVSTYLGLENNVLISPLIWSTADLEQRLAHELTLAEDIFHRGLAL